MSSLHRAASPPERSPDDLEALFLPIVLMLAVGLPFLVVSTRSDQALHETKLFALAASSAAALAALALSRGRPARNTAPLLLRISGWALAGSFLLALASGIGNHVLVDPLSALAALAPAALFLAGASDAARRVTSRLLGVLAVCGAFTGLMAFGQRFLHVPRLPADVPQPRFKATALIGNPGDLAAALVLPALVLSAWAMDDGLSRRARVAAGIGFLACGLGFGASQTVAPIFALGAGLLVHAFFAPRRRLLPLLGALLLGAVVLGVTGTAGRVLEKLRDAREGRMGSALTQRDIGLTAGLEMVVRAPFFGFGPGCYENAFTHARLAAERRHHRHFIHLSDSSHFENAHCDPLTLAAECGVPAALLSLLAFGALVFALLRSGDARRDLLAAPLVAFLVLSLGSFPLRMPATAGAFALLCGLAWHGSGGEPLAAFPRFRRGLFACGAALLLVLSALRLLSALSQARGEATLRLAAVAPSQKADILAEARRELERAIALRPRSPSPWLALGSCELLGGDVDRAWELAGRSFALEERAETDLNLGRIAFASWDRVTAQALFVRAVWLHPRLVLELDESHAPGAVELDVEEAQDRFERTGEVPALPPSADALRLRHRFP